MKRYRVKFIKVKYGKRPADGPAENLIDQEVEAYVRGGLAVHPGVRTPLVLTVGAGEIR